MTTTQMETDDQELTTPEVYMTIAELEATDQETFAEMGDDRDEDDRQCQRRRLHRHRRQLRRQHHHIRVRAPTLYICPSLCSLPSCPPRSSSQLVRWHCLHAGRGHFLARHCPTLSAVALIFQGPP